MKSLSLGRDICRDFNLAVDREWLVTNGLGGYASATITGTNTRRYHGLLVAALNPPLGRTVLLSKLDEEITIGEDRYFLGANEYPNDTVHPGGFVYLQEARLDLGIPSFRYLVGGASLTKTVWMEYGANTTYITYSLDPASPRSISIGLVALANYRDYHGDTNGSMEWNFAVRPIPGGCEVQAFPGAVPFRIITSPQAVFVTTGVWYWHLLYRRERERGLRFMEDLYMPGLFRATVAPGDYLTVIVTTEDPATVGLDGENALERRRQRQVDLLATARKQMRVADLDPVSASLVLAADQFIVSRSEVAADRTEGSDVAGTAANAGEAGPPDQLGCSVATDCHTMIAGYHWFGDWGRDAMISLPGVALLTGRLNEARSVLRTFARYTDQGMIPNRFPDRGTAPEYNNVDATLWYFQALRSYLIHTEDYPFLAEVYPVLAEIVDWHLKGTRYNIRVDGDGLIRAGEEGVQLTWMDAKVGDWVVTPRRGKPVEVNALWYNALMFMGEWSERLGQSAGRYRELSGLTRHSFGERFWNEATGHLFDVIDGPEGDDPSLRPNQIFAISLPFPLLEGQKAAMVLDAMSASLLTPRGLRTLTPRDPRYGGRYRGDQWHRDSAYHQGTVWPWLIGAYVEAHLRIKQDVAFVRELLNGYAAHLLDAGIGTASEIFEGDMPHSPCGCVAQAWSVAELLRASHIVRNWKES